MKLLIVDDEELTRTGVITSLDWASLGIDEVLQADDGVHGLETARLCKPEIILCDVCVCPAWMVFPCWNVWKSFFLILFRSS